MNISEYLKSLGNTSEDVANSLRAQGIKGKKLSLSFCPILNGIYKACPNYWVGLSIHGGRVGGKSSYSAALNDAQICDPSLPQAVQDFIGDFDCGKYPDLEVEEVTEVVTRVW